MATLDLSRATMRVDMTDYDLVKFGTVEQQTSQSWSFTNGGSNDLQLDGNGMTFDRLGRALKGKVTSIGIDLGDDDFDNPDILITGMNTKAARLDDGAPTFWRLLEGDDTIVGPTNGTLAGNVVSADGDQATSRYTKGGNDTILWGAAGGQIMGDVWSVSASTGPKLRFQGGNDEIVGTASTQAQYLIGDANNISAGGKLFGGDDTIYIDSTDAGSFAAGDARGISGFKGRTATLDGGDDRIVAGGRSVAVLVGDVQQQHSDSTVRGGDDVLIGADAMTLVGEANEIIVGDVVVTNGVLVGGNDKIWGNDGDDRLYGDAVFVGSQGRVTAGHDTVRGGAGDDIIFGDGPTELGIRGGNDRLYGDAGHDTIWGGGGDDTIVGGTGVDRLIGGTGNDTYVVDASDSLHENLNEGIDTVLTEAGAFALPANIENLVYTGTFGFFGVGNELANTITGASGADYLQGLGGNDKLIGGARNDSLYGGAQDDTLVGGSGADHLDGGDGIDVASYEGAERGVAVSLDGGLVATNDALGDSFVGIEGLLGSSYADRLQGNADANMLDGGSGSDVLLGMGGADVLLGGLGADSLSGGAGNDRFVFKNVSESGLKAATRDLITDFTSGEDVIDLRAIDANIGKPGDQAFKLFAMGSASASVGTGKIGWYQIDRAGTANDLTILKINNDADAAIDMTVAVKGLVDFTAADFIL